MNSEVEIMQKKEKSKVLKELQQIPSVGKSISEDLWELGIRSVKDYPDKTLKICIKNTQY